MPLDQHALGDLVEESQDLHVDAMRTTRERLDELVETEHERRSAPDCDPVESALGVDAAKEGISRGLVGAGAVAATAFGAALMGLAASPAFAAGSMDVQMLQTAASIENLAVSTYKTALTLPYIGGSSANPVVKAFAQTTMGQHQDHADAFNAAAKSLGGEPGPQVRARGELGRRFHHEGVAQRRRVGGRQPGADPGERGGRDVRVVLLEVRRRQRQEGHRLDHGG